jgi:hypothetical protein
MNKAIVYIKLYCAAASCVARVGIVEAAALPCPETKALVSSQGVKRKTGEWPNYTFWAAYELCS